jgi:V8-like Glu-specific endopeptidase
MHKNPEIARWRGGAVSSALGLVLLLTSGLGCSASGGEAVGDVAQPIAGGTSDGAHENVFLLVQHQKDSGALCTATLIAPNLLLTARHCVSPGEDDHVLCGEAALGTPFPASAFFATNDEVPNDKSLVFHGADVEVPVEDGDTCGYDIALIRLNELVPPSVALPAVPRIDREVTPGESYTAVGYGVNANGQANRGRMQRSGLSIACQPGSCGSGVESTEFRGDDGICSGDSGGPALDADGKVVGVVSRGGPNCGTPVYGTVTAWRDFLVTNAKAAAVAGGYDPPFWVTTGLSDPPAPPAATGAAGAAGAAGTPSAGQGEPCSGPSSCADGLACYSADGKTDDAACVATCTKTSDCADGLVCEALGGASVCLAPSRGADESGGCALAAAPSGTPGAWLVAGLGALAVFVCKRSSATARGRRRARPLA